MQPPPQQRGGPTEQQVAAAGAPNTAPDHTAQATRLGFAVGLATIWSAIVVFFTAVGWLILYTLPIIFLVGGLIGSAIWRQQWLDARSQFAYTDSPQVRRFIDNINIYEDIANFFFFTLAALINVWNYFILVLWHVIQLFYNIFLFVIKYIVQPYFQYYVVPVYVTGAQIIGSLVDELTLSLSSSETFETTGSGGVIANYTRLGNFTTTELATRGFQTIMSFQPFFVAMNASQYGNMVNFLADPVLKNAPEIFKFLADIAALTSIGGAWTRVIAEDAISQQANALLVSSNCFGARAVRAGLCATQTWLAESVNKVAHVDGMRIASPTCNIPEIACAIPSGTYSNQGRTPWDTDQFFESLFGSGVCGPLECEYFVEDAYASFASQPGATCANWVDDPDAIYNCMVLVQNYVDVNTTSRAQASPATLAAEMCIVARAQNMQSCAATGRPFQWSFETQATNICNNPSYNTTYAECSCRYRAPLCTAGCCESYALHVHKQTMSQLGFLTCAEWIAYFPTLGSFCPLIGPNTINRTATTARFPDNTYQSLFCAYAQDVIDPICAYAPPFAHLIDLNTASALARYTVSACNATIGQLGACLPVNATVDDLAFDIISYPITENTDAVYNTNDVTTYTLGTYLVTDFSVGDDAQTIVQKGLQKHFCEQFSQIFKNKNMVYRSRPWSPLGQASAFCDSAVLTAAADISIGNSAFYKYQNGYGVPIPVDVAGLPDTVSVFSEDVNPNLQIGGVCTGQVGPNVDELTSQDKCLETIRLLIYNVAGQATIDTTALLNVFVAQNNYTSEFYTASGLVPISPDDPNYAQKEIELQRTIMALDTGLGYDIIPWDDLIAATDPFRTTFDVVPPNSSPYSNMPAYPVYTDQSGLGGAPPTGDSSSSSTTSVTIPGGPGRVLLSVEDESGEESTDFEVDWWGRVREFMGGPPRGTEPDKWDRASEALFRKRLIRLGQRLHDEVYLKGKEEEKAKQSAGRHLMSTGNPAIDTKLSAINRDMSNIPHHPKGLTEDKYFRVMLADTLRLASNAFHISAVVVLPRFLEVLGTMYNTPYGFNATEVIETNPFRYNDARAANSSSHHQTTTEEPMNNCQEFSDSYECCNGLRGCIDFDCKPYLQARTTKDNLEKWNCHEVDYFFGWQRWFWQCFVSVIASFASKHFTSTNSYDTFPGTLVTPYADLPPNLVNCFFVNMYFGFVGANIIAFIYFVMTVGVIGLFAILFSNFRQQQEDQEYSEDLTFRLAEEMNRRAAPGAAERDLVNATTYRPPTVVQ